MLRLFISFIVTAFIFAGVIAPTAVYAEQSSTTQSTQKDPKPAKKTDKKKSSSKTVVETQKILFKTRNQDDPNTPKGQTTVLQQGVNGTKKVTYKVTYPKGKKAKKTFVSQKIVIPAVDKVIGVGVGTFVAPPPPPAPVAPAPSAPSGNTYTNVDGNQIEGPSSNTAGATGVCRDGSFTHAVHHQGACSSHGGVDHWL